MAKSRSVECKAASSEVMFMLEYQKHKAIGYLWKHNDRASRCGREHSNAQKGYLGWESKSPEGIKGITE